MMMLNMTNPLPVKRTETNDKRVHLFWENCHIQWAGRQPHHEPPRHGKKRFRIAEQFMEVIQVQHQDQSETAQELCTFQSTVRLRVLKDDKK